MAIIAILSEWCGGDAGVGTCRLQPLSFCRRLYIFAKLDNNIIIITMDGVALRDKAHQVIQAREDAYVKCETDRFDFKAVRRQIQNTADQGRFSTNVLDINRLSGWSFCSDRDISDERRQHLFQTRICREFKNRFAHELPPGSESPLIWCYKSTIDASWTAAPLPKESNNNF